MDFEQFVAIVGSNLRKARWTAGLSQEAASAEVLTFRLLAALERGDGNPTLRSLWLLAEKYKVAVKDLVETGKEKPLPEPLAKLKVEKPPRRRPVHKVPSPRARRSKTK
jgi:transcriptional regulator with XRE-family HTH domain